jgi:hypothetical protein
MFASPISEEKNTTFFYDTFLKIFNYSTSFCLHCCILPRYLHKKYLLYRMLPLSIRESTNAFFRSNFGNSRGKYYCLLYGISKINLLCCSLSLSVGELSSLRALLLSYYPLFFMAPWSPIDFFSIKPIFSSPQITVQAQQKIITMALQYHFYITSMVLPHR